MGFSTLTWLLSLVYNVAMLLLRYFTDMFDRYSIFEVSIQPDIYVYPIIGPNTANIRDRYLIFEIDV